jgi:hypothetical protein
MVNILKKCLNLLALTPMDISEGDLTICYIIFVILNVPCSYHNSGLHLFIHAPTHTSLCHFKLKTVYSIVFARSNTAIVGSNPTEAWMFVCVLCAFFLFLHSLK